MITKVRVKNFKSWKDTTDLQLSPLTGFFGTNSSGKSSILQLLLLLKQSVESTDRNRVLHTGDENSFVDLGTFYDFIYSHNTKASLAFSLAWKTEQLESVQFDSIIKEEMSPIVEQFLYTFLYRKNLCRFGMRYTEAKEKNEYEIVAENYKLSRFQGRPWPLPSPSKFYGFPEELWGYYKNVNFLSNIVLEFEKLFSRITYLGPLREFPKRSYIWAGQNFSDVGRKGEFTIPVLLSSRHREKVPIPRYKKRKVSVEDAIAYWLKEMGLIDSYTLKPIAKNRKEYELHVKKTPSSPEVLITDVGFGVSQILPILVLCYSMPSGSIILLEQPEIHLHPSVQSWLTDVFIDVVQHRNIQIILESHSEHLLRRLQRRIAEGQIESNQTSLYFCKIENSASTIEKLDIDPVGNIRNWPNDFFGDEMEDIVKMTEAAMTRTMQGDTSK